MTTDQELLPPLQSMIIASYDISSFVEYISGYLTDHDTPEMSHAHYKGMKYANDALASITKARKDINEIEGKEVQNVELGQLRASIYRAKAALADMHEDYKKNNDAVKYSKVYLSLAALQDVKKEHLVSGRILPRHGFDDIPSEELKKLGAVDR